MLGTKRPAPTPDPSSTTPTGSKRFKPNRHQPPSDPPSQSSQPSSTWLGLWSSVKKLVGSSSSTRSVVDPSRSRTAGGSANIPSRSRHTPVKQRSVSQAAKAFPTFESLNDDLIWKMITARQRGQPPPSGESNVLREVRLSRENAARAGSKDVRKSSVDGQQRPGSGSGGGYQRKKPMGAKEHRLALKTRDDQTMEQLKSLPSTPLEPEEQEPQDGAQEFEVYKRGVRNLVETEDAYSGTMPVRRPDQGRSSSSLLGPPSASYASVVSSSLSSKQPAKTPSRPLSKVERTIENYRRTQTESPAKAQEVFAQFERLRVQQELEEQKALAELEKSQANLIQRKRKWPKGVPREIQDRVAKILRQPGYEKTIPGASVDSKAIKRLRPGTWLDDSIIAFYGVLINNRFLEAEKKDDLGKGETRLRKVWCFNSFFWNMYEENGYKRVKKWTKKFDTFEKDIIIFPINIHNSHWTCAAVNIKKKRFEYYDSLGAPLHKAYKLLRKWLQEEHECKKGSSIDLSDWEDYWDPDVPQQDNCNDCGVFTCCFMETLSREYEGFDFDQRQMPYLRQKVAYEIDRAELLTEEFE